MVYTQIHQIGDPEDKWIGPFKRKSPITYVGGKMIVLIVQEQYKNLRKQRMVC